MELLLFMMFIFIIMIFFKVSSMATRLEMIEDLLQKHATVEPKAKESVPNRATVSSSLVEQKSEIVAERTHDRQEEVSALKPTIRDIKEVKAAYKKMHSQEASWLKRAIMRLKKQSLEELLFGNIILKISIVAFILGVGLFLKYSIDKEWIPIWGRVLIGIIVGIAMLVAGIKMIYNQHKLFSETLFGGGIAVLYLSIFAGYALEGFIFISITTAYTSMVAITFLAGLISVRFDAKSTAIFGLIGGFATPFLLSTGSENYVGLLGYMLLLNLGILFISIYKKWSLLSWMAFMITSLSSISSAWQSNNAFYTLVGLFAAFFIIYSIVPFLNEIRAQKASLEKSFVLLFWSNFMVALVAYLALFKHYNIPLLYYAVVTVVMAGYLLLYAFFLVQKKILLKNLFYIVLTQSMALLLLTPAFIFNGSSLTMVWALESLMLLYIAHKTKERTYGLFGLLGFGITVLRYVLFDLLLEYEVFVMYGDKASILYYVQSLAISSLFVIGALFIGYSILKKSDLEWRYIKSDTVHIALFLVSFVGAYLSLTFMSLLLLELYSPEFFSMVYMGIIALFSFLLYRSEHRLFRNIIVYFFLGVLLIGFVNNLLNISGVNVTMALFNFLVFMVVVILIYQLFFKSSTLQFATYKLSNILLSVGILLLFIFLNVELYHLVKLYSPAATKFAITLLWVGFGIVLFVYGMINHINIVKVVGTVLIFLAIIKAFFWDLGNLDAIYRIVLFLILGAILFGLSYFYQREQSKYKEER